MGELLEGACEKKMFMTSMYTSKKEEDDRARQINDNEFILIVLAFFMTYRISLFFSSFIFQSFTYFSCGLCQWYRDE